MRQGKTGRVRNRQCEVLARQRNLWETQVPGNRRKKKDGMKSRGTVSRKKRENVHFKKRGKRKTECQGFAKNSKFHWECASSDSGGENSYIKEDKRWSEKEKAAVLK